MSFSVIAVKIEAQVTHLESPFGFNLDGRLLSARRAGADQSAPCRGLGSLLRSLSCCHAVLSNDMHFIQWLCSDYYNISCWNISCDIELCETIPDVRTSLGRLLGEWEAVGGAQDHEPTGSSATRSVADLRRASCWSLGRRAPDLLSMYR